MLKVTSYFVLFFLLVPLSLVTAATYSDDFTQDDGAPDGWTVVVPNVVVESGQLALTPGGGEECAFVGSEGDGYFNTITHIEFDLAYPGDTTAWPYDHGGVIFCAKSKNLRTQTTCYVIDHLANGPDDNTAGRFRLARFDNGTEVPLTNAPNITEYEGKWEIDLTETTITFTFNGVEQFSFDDAQLRGGYVGFWAYGSPPENKMTVDNFSLDFVPAECPVFTLDSAVVTEGGGNVIVPVRIPFGSNDTEPVEVTVTSLNSDVASPVTGTMTFAVGAPATQNLEIASGVQGDTLLSIEGYNCPGTDMSLKVLAPVAFEEDFAQADGPPEGWYVASDTAQVINEELSLSAPGQPFCWYAIDGVPVNVAKIDSVSFRIKYSPAALPVGAHGGMILAPAAGAVRDKGYMIDVIERDAAYRLYKDNNANVPLAEWPPYVRDDEWHTWEITFVPTGFRFSVDGVELAVVNDMTYRGGYLAFWCYTGAAGQNVFVDDISISFGADACSSLSPVARETLPGLETLFNVDAPFGANSAGDYTVDVTSSQADVALPVGTADGVLTLDTFPQSDTFSQTSFKVEGLIPGVTDIAISSQGAASCMEKHSTVTVLQPTSFADDFSQADGLPENWTIYDGHGWLPGEWQVLDNKLVVDSTGGGEKWLWLPVKQAVKKISFTMVITNDAPDAVGRHGGIMFCAQDPTNRWETSGYDFDWIDREADRGYRMTRFDNGVQTALSANTGTAFDLGTNWEIEFVGTMIRLTVDGTVIGEVEDVTYRSGYFAFWAYGNGSHFEIDDVVLGEPGTRFMRGDVNADNSLNIADPIGLLGYLFSGQSIPCFDAADSNDDGNLDISDAINILGYLFAEGDPLPDPFMECGLDGTDDDLGCESFDSCQ